MRVALLTLSLLVSFAAQAETRRYAIVVGNNAGSGELPPLRYAETDAGKVARVLAELGQVAPEDLLLLQGRTRDEISAALQDLQARVAEVHRSPDERAVVLFYFSGHSDGLALEIGTERLPFAELRAALQATGAELRVAIIDSCRSGAALLEKGGRPAEGFSIRLADELTTKGDAVLTSSAADEAALESKDVMGSIFTHHLVSGLRGAADSSGDHRVTLAEAYRYAYDRTISATAATTVGAQHPAYDFRLSGQGELVLTSLEKPTAALALPQGFDRALVTDLTRDQIVAELASSDARQVALPPGRYGVKAFRAGTGFGGRFELQSGVHEVKWDELSPLAPTVVSSKGAAPEVQAEAESRLALTVGAGASAGVARALAVAGSLRVGLERGGASLNASGYSGSGPGFSESGLFLRGGYALQLDASFVQLRLALELGPGVVWQVSPGASGFSFAFEAGPRAECRFRLTGPISLTVATELPAALLRINDAVSFALLPGAHIGFAVDL